MPRKRVSIIPAMRRGPASDHSSSARFEGKPLACWHEVTFTPRNIIEPCKQDQWLPKSLKLTWLRLTASLACAEAPVDPLDAAGTSTRAIELPSLITLSREGTLLGASSPRPQIRQHSSSCHRMPVTRRAHSLLISRPQAAFTRRLGQADAC